MRYHARCSRVEIIKRDRIIRRDPVSLPPVVREIRTRITRLRVLVEPGSTDSPLREILRYISRKIWFMLSHRSMLSWLHMRWPKMLKHESRTRDSVRSTQKLGVYPTFIIWKKWCTAEGGRQNTVYFCTLREKEREKKRKRESFILQVRTWMSRFTVRRSRV